MRPTFSIIAFTVLSGAGYGVLFLLGITLATRCPNLLANAPRIDLGIALATGFALTSLGLLASVTHLGQPLRAWRAFSQWRSSWLSREGVASLLTCAPMLAIAIALFARLDAHVGLRLFGLLLALCCIVTVCCTARIYSSLQPIRAWCNRYTLPVYLLLALYSGALWMCALSFGILAASNPIARGFSFGALLLVALASVTLKLRYWRSLDALAPISAGEATGLDRFGTVHSVEQPHTEENYLTHEMGFVLARKHSRRLRAIALGLIVLAPIAMLLLGQLIGWPGAWLAVVAGMLGVFVERWLFFAEAQHAVMAYYAR